MGPMHKLMAGGGMALQQRCCSKADSTAVDVSLRQHGVRCAHTRSNELTKPPFAASYSVHTPQMSHLPVRLPFVLHD